jgi:hypothetical protein
MQSYSKPAITEVGSVRELTLAANLGGIYDGQLFHYGTATS